MPSAQYGKKLAFTPNGRKHSNNAQYRRASGIKNNSRTYTSYTVTMRLLDTGEQIAYDVLAYNDPLANTKAIEQAEKDGYKPMLLELVEIRLTA